MLFERLWAIGWGGCRAAAYGARAGHRGGKLQLFVLDCVNTFPLYRIAVTYSRSRFSFFSFIVFNVGAQSAFKGIESWRKS